MANLPQFQSDDRNFQMMQTQWGTILNPVVSSPIVQGRLLTGVSLVTGSNTINTLLGRKLQGYIVVLQSANITVYDTQSTNPMPEKTLVLVASGPATVSLWCF